jgi:hypothetical protein
VDDEITASPNTENPQGNRQRRVWILTALFVVVFSLLRTLPWNVRVIPVPEDDSWDLALNYFTLHRANCGLDYVFTFGPLGFVYNSTYFPHTFNLKLVVQGLMCTLTMSILVLQGKRIFANPLWTVVWIFAILAWYGFFADVMFLSIPMLLINQHFLLDGRKNQNSFEALMLVFLLALTAIVKFTFTVAAVWTIAFIAIDELFVKRSRPVLSLAFVVLVPLLWLISGQPIYTLAPYIANSLQVASGHSEAMSFVENPNWLMPVAVAAASALAVFLSFSKLTYSRLSTGFITALLAESGLFFLVFKAAYVRHTHDHEPIASSVFGFAALALIPFILKTETHKLARWLGVGAIVFMTIVTLPMSLPVDAPAVTRYPMLLLSNVLSVFQKALPCISYVTGSSDLDKNFQARMAEIRKENALPEIKGSVDIYPVMCKVPIAYGLDYKPRPVFQSYLAYREPLARLNDEHLRSSKAADTIVVQKLQDCYGYYPMLYDGPSWIDLLTRYQLQSCQPAGLILTKRSSPKAMELFPLESQNAKLGDPISLEQFKNKTIFARMELKLTLAGRLQKLFFRIYPPEIEVVLTDGSKRKFIAPSEITKSGFIITPFAESPEQVAKLFSASPSQTAEVTSFTLSQSKNDFDWAVFEPNYSLELSELSAN